MSPLLHEHAASVRTRIEALTSKTTPTFATEKQRCLSMLDRFLAKPLTEPWPRAANFAMTGSHWSQLQFKHLNHHLTQAVHSEEKRRHSASARVTTADLPD